MINAKIRLNEGKDEISAVELTKEVMRKGVAISGFFDHSKAAERYVILSIDAEGSTREWYLPYYYRRTNEKDKCAN